MRLVADVGGTNTRLALSRAGVIKVSTVQRYENAKWNNLSDLIWDYLGRHDLYRIAEMVIAVAGPVHGDRAQLTNRGWVIESDRLISTFCVTQVHLLNDLTALGYSVPILRPDQCAAISAGVPNQSGISQSLVVGIGTGCNVSPVIQNAGMVQCPAAEAGHLSMPISIIDRLSAFGVRGKSFPTIEALFSGRGFTTFCQGFTGEDTVQGTIAIKSYGVPGADEITSAVDHYASLLGLLLREFSLSYWPSSGIYFAGSVACAVVTKSPEPCLEAFEAPCRIGNNKSIPIWKIEDDSAALSGCAGYVFL